MKKEDEVKEKERWTAAAWDMLYLVQCGIHSVLPDPERIAKMDLENVFVKSKNQSLEVLTCMALESLLRANPQIQIPDEKQVLPRWKEAENKAIAKNLMMDAAREQLFAFMEERGIWHVALKGVVLCHIYPKYEMRQMADNDILFDASFRQEVHDWFVEQGYTVESFQKGYHDTYLKKPVYNFEMHTALFRANEQPQLVAYYAALKDRLVQKAGKKFEYYMTDEDFYLYLIAHEYKHCSNSGVGIRALLDLYVYYNVKKDMDRSYLDHELEKMGLLAFEHTMRELSDKVLSPKAAAAPFMDDLSEQEQVVLHEMMTSGTYGNLQRHWKNQIQRIEPSTARISAAGKLQYLKCRLFPDEDYMEVWCKRYAPYFLEHRGLMPVAQFWRIVKIGMKKRKQIKEELDTVRKA